MHCQCFLFIGVRAPAATTIVKVTSLKISYIKVFRSQGLRCIYIPMNSINIDLTPTIAMGLRCAYHRPGNYLHDICSYPFPVPCRGMWHMQATINCLWNN